MKIILIIGIMGIICNFGNVAIAGFDGNWHAMWGWICSTLFSFGALGLIIEIGNLKKVKK